MKKIIYADNAATTRMDDVAVKAMERFFMEEYANASEPYSFSRTAKKALKEARAAVAAAIGAESEEIHFTSCGTESDNWVIKGSAYKTHFEKEIITSEIEHHAILKSCRFLEKMGCKITCLPVNEEGTLLPETLENAISENTHLVSVMFSNNEIGTVEPIKELARIAHQHGALFHTDAVQSVGHLPINVKELDVDFLSASAHKFNGPKGIGFLYIKKGVDLPSFMDGGSQEMGKRAGTENVASIVAMAAALQHNVENLIENKSHIEQLEERLLSELEKRNIPFHRNGGKCHVPGNISLSFENREGDMLLQRMDLKGICISTGSACDSVNLQISHVLKAIHLKESLAKGTIRISLGKYNTEEDVLNIASALEGILLK